MPESAACREPTAEQAAEREIVRLNKIIRALMDRAERSANAQGSDFDLFQTTIMLEEQVLSRTAELQAALGDNENITHELRQTQSRLVATARQAGMAEIATNVLHNVGNVLNSVNVSAELVSRKVRASKAQGLAKAVRLINEHSADLGDFLSHDAKGKLLPAYLNQLVEAIAAEQQGIVEELEHLTRSIGHIKEIVATQQSYAGASSMIEPVRLADLLEDALRIHAEALNRQRISVIKAFAATPPLLLDKHRLLLILVNLISNAKDALSVPANQSPTLTLSVRLLDETTVQIRVQDDGEGIAAENLTRIFAHGFTTRKDGHGFGLHSCALAAMEMGGSLTAHSDGPDRGATFTLELPIAATLDSL